MFDSKPADGIDRVEIYKIYKSYLEHENLLLNQRVTWLVTIQSFFLAAYAIPLGRIEINTSLIMDWKDIRTFYAVSLCIGAFCACIASFMSIIAATNAQKDIEKKWLAEHRDDAVRLGLPHIAGGGSKNRGKLGGTFARVIPVIMALFWLVNLTALIFRLNTDLFPTITKMIGIL